MGDPGSRRPRDGRQRVAYSCSHPDPAPHWVNVAGYERHEPEKTLLHEVVREQLEGFLASSCHRDQAPPRFVEQALRSFLRWGVLAHGFLRLHCDDCGHELAF